MYLLRHSRPVVAFCVCLCTGIAAPAATFTVDTEADLPNPGTNPCTNAIAGQCSLRSAIQEANALGGGPHTITLRQSVTDALSLTVSGDEENLAASGDLDVTSDIVIVGVLDVTPDWRVSIDATGLGDRVFDIRPGRRLRIEDLMVTGGTAMNGLGGGFRNEGTLEIHRCTVDGNTALGEKGQDGQFPGAGGGGGGGAGLGGGVYNTGTLTITESQISNNRAQGGDGGKGPSNGGQFNGTGGRGGGRKAGLGGAPGVAGQDGGFGSGGGGGGGSASLGAAGGAGGFGGGGGGSGGRTGGGSGQAGGAAGFSAGAGASGRSSAAGGGGGGAGIGGGIFNHAGTVTIVGSYLYNQSAGGAGGISTFQSPAASGTGLAGCYYNLGGTITVTRSRVYSYDSDPDDADADDILDSIDPCPNLNPNDLDEDGVCDNAEPSRLYVNAAATGNDSGGDWANAHRELQTAIAVAENSGGAVREIWVAHGIYLPDYDVVFGRHTGDTGSWFSIGQDMRLYGGFAGSETTLEQRDPAAHPTILSGDLAGNDVADLTPLMACLDWETPAPPACLPYDVNGDKYVDAADVGFGENTWWLVGMYDWSGGTLLDGFVLRHANGTAIEVDDFSDVVLRNCTFEQNLGGAIEHFDGSLLVQNCRFLRNVAQFLDAPMAVSGDVRVENSLFDGNRGQVDGGAISSGGWLQLSGCTFLRNSAGNPDGSGGAILNNGGMLDISYCMFLGNTAPGRGGAIYSAGYERPSVYNSLFASNAAGVAGGAISAQDEMEITLTTFAGNTCKARQAAGIHATDYAAVYNSILWGNTADSDGDEGGPYQDESAQVASRVYSDVTIIQGGQWNADPLFVDPDGADQVPGTLDDNYALRPGSPAIDAGQNSWTLDIFVDLAGRVRFFDDPSTPDTGLDPPPIVDLGPYEFIAPVPGDTDQDGDVDDLDVQAFKACARGPAIPHTPGCNGADFDADGDADMDDFGVVQRCYTGESVGGEPNCAN